MKTLLKLIRYRYKDGAPTGIRKALSNTDCNWWEFKKGAIKLSGAPSTNFPKIAYALSTVKYVRSFYNIRRSS